MTQAAAIRRGTHCAPENGSIERERLPRRRPARVGGAHVFRQGDQLRDDLRGLDRPVLVAAEGLFQQVGEGACLDDVPALTGGWRGSARVTVLPPAAPPT